ncbi:hypothetical protein BCR34DRAFT_317512 [Clohesyomyces aquaticus]|uniref:Uncharacterized protein n=1 Tax=Clohesyomyces aquaticus TaxID=1231657 RepID=A0A1Y1XW07_9PLEO|nr:hypothetical protein BCR34DRAFT_317512 [Clohesyomyces aquaticus]
MRIYQRPGYKHIHQNTHVKPTKRQRKDLSPAITPQNQRKNPEPAILIASLPKRQDSRKERSKQNTQPEPKQFPIHTKDITNPPSPLRTMSRLSYVLQQESDVSPSFHSSYTCGPADREYELPGGTKTKRRRESKDRGLGLEGAPFPRHKPSPAATLYASTQNRLFYPASPCLAPRR